MRALLDGTKTHITKKLNAYMKLHIFLVVKSQKPFVLCPWSPTSASHTCFGILTRDLSDNKLTTLPNNWLPRRSRLRFL